jgi:hypothetical protein
MKLMTVNSTHIAIIAIALVASVAMFTETDLEKVVPILAPLGLYAGMREYKRIKTADKDETKWSGSKEESLDEIID